jgi:DNA-binding MarR family transcriptional regulator
MGRGLSELQKRILLYALRHKEVPLGWERRAPWFDGIPEARPAIGEAILPGKWGSWTLSDVASISRALRRLQGRGLVSRSRVFLGTSSKRRTKGIMLTRRGEEVAKSLETP